MNLLCCEHKESSTWLHGFLLCLGLQSILCYPFLSVQLQHEVFAERQVRRDSCGRPAGDRSSRSLQYDSDITWSSAAQLLMDSLSGHSPY